MTAQFRPSKSFNFSKREFSSKGEKKVFAQSGVSSSNGCTMTLVKTQWGMDVNPHVSRPAPS